VYAIISDKERQFMVRQGDTILVDKKDLQPGEEIRFDQVLCLDGKPGTPFLEGAAVSGVVRGGVKGPKIYVQKFTRIEITGIVS